MLACYCLQGKQLASGMIGLLTCQSHYNVSGINRTPCARLLLRHPLAQRIPTEACECSVTVRPAHSIQGALPTQCIARIDQSVAYLEKCPDTFEWHLIPTLES